MAKAVSALTDFASGERYCSNSCRQWDKLAGAHGLPAMRHETGCGFCGETITGFCTECQKPGQELAVVDGTTGSESYIDTPYGTCLGCARLAEEA